MPATSGYGVAGRLSATVTSRPMTAGEVNVRVTVSGRGMTSAAVTVTERNLAAFSCSAALRGGNQLTLASARISVSPPADGSAAVPSSALVSPAASDRGLYATHSTVTVFVVPGARPSPAQPIPAGTCASRNDCTAAAGSRTRTNRCSSTVCGPAPPADDTLSGGGTGDGWAARDPAGTTSRESICLASVTAAAREPAGARVAAGPVACAAGRDAAVPQPASIAANASTATLLPRMATSQPRFCGT